MNTRGLKISPRALALAMQNQIDVLKIVPTGPDGRIIERDILRALEQEYLIETQPAPVQAAPVQETPVVENVVNAPVLEEPTPIFEEPVAEEVVEEIAEESVAEEAVEEIAEEPVVEEALEEIAEEPVAEEVVEEIAEESVMEEVVEEITEEPVAEEAVEEIAEEPVAEEAVEEITEEPVAEEAVEEITEEPVAEEVVEEITEEPVAEEVVEEITEEPVAEEAVEEIAEEPVVEEEIEEIAEESVMEEAVEEITEEPVAEEAVEEIAEEPVAEEAIEEIAEEPVVEEALEEITEEPELEIEEIVEETEEEPEIEVEVVLESEVEEEKAEETAVVAAVVTSVATESSKENISAEAEETKEKAYCYNTDAYRHTDVIIPRTEKAPDGTPVTISMSFDATAIVKLHAMVKENAEAMGLPHITINDMILFATAKLLKKNKALNAHFLGDKIRYFDGVHLGFVVDTGHGMEMPTVFDADRLSLSSLAKITGALIRGARAGGSSPEKNKRLASFMVSNLGMLGVEQFTPVLTAPQTGSLGVSALQRRVKEVGGKDVFYSSIPLALTFDPRALDTTSAAKFLRELCASLENFELLLIK